MDGSHPGGPDEPAGPEQWERFLAHNLEHAVLCAESARQVVEQLGAAEHLPTLEEAIAHALHFLHLARVHLEEYRRSQSIALTGHAGPSGPSEEGANAAP